MPACACHQTFLPSSAPLVRSGEHFRRLRRLRRTARVDPASAGNAQAGTRRDLAAMAPGPLTTAHIGPPAGMLVVPFPVADTALRATTAASSVSGGHTGTLPRLVLAAGCGGVGTDWDAHPATRPSRRGSPRTSPQTKTDAPLACLPLVPRGHLAGLRHLVPSAPCPAHPHTAIRAHHLTRVVAQGDDGLLTSRQRHPARSNQVGCARWGKPSTHADSHPPSVGTLLPPR